MCWSSLCRLLCLLVCCCFMSSMMNCNNRVHHCLWQIVKVKPILSRANFEKWINIFITALLDCGSSVLMWICQISLSSLQVVLLTQSCRSEYVTLILVSLPHHYTGSQCATELSRRFCCLFLNILTTLPPSYLTDLLQPFCPPQSLRSADQLLLTVPQYKLKLRHFLPQPLNSGMNCCCTRPPCFQISNFFLKQLGMNSLSFFWTCLATSKCTLWVCYVSALWLPMLLLLFF